MQGNRRPDQQAMIYPLQGARVRDRSQQPDRLPEQYIPTDDELLQQILLRPLLTLIELLLRLWPALPYRALPGQDSATATRRRWPAAGGSTCIQTAAHWLRAQLRRLHREGHIEVQKYPDGLCYLPAGLALLHQPEPVRLLEFLTGEEVKLCPSTGCVVAPNNLDLEQPFAKVRIRRRDQMALLDYRTSLGASARTHRPLYPLGDHVAGQILVASDADQPHIWRLCKVLTTARGSGSASQGRGGGPAAAGPGDSSPRTKGGTVVPFTFRQPPAPVRLCSPQAQLLRVAAALRAGRGPRGDLMSPSTGRVIALPTLAVRKDSQREVDHA